MEKDPDNNSAPETLAEYDFSEGRRGRYSERYATGNNVVLLDPDVAEVFPDSASVNRALRALVDIMRRHSAGAGS